MSEESESGGSKLEQATINNCGQGSESEENIFEELNWCQVAGNIRESE